MKQKAESQLETLAVSEGEKHAEFKRRRDSFSYMKVPKDGEAPYLQQGWAIEKALKRQLRLRKEKEFDRQLEDKVWRMFYRMGFDELNKGYEFVVRFKASDGSYRTKQVDLFAKDAETIVVGECKACDEYKPRSLGSALNEFIGFRKQFSDAFRAHYGKEFKPKILWFFFTDKVIWSKADREKAQAENIHIMTEREADYFSQLADHLGRATRYQFLAEYLGGQKIPEMSSTKVPAIRGKLGGRPFYSFVSTAEQLLKICFVNHRTLADPLALPTYQRLVKKSRLKAISEFINAGGYFPTNILINFDRRCRFDRQGGDLVADVQFGELHLPERYKSAWIVDGQHRLYGYSIGDPQHAKQNIAVIAFEGMTRDDEAKLFVTINHEQKSVPRTLLDELDADLKWGSSVPSERLSAVAARVVQLLTETVGSAMFKRVVAQGMQGDEVVCLTMPEIKGGIVRSRLIGSLAQKRKLMVNGPLTGESDEKTVRRAAQGIDLFLSKIRESCPARWDAGRTGGLCVNVGFRALMLLYMSLIDHAQTKSKNFDPENNTPDEVAQHAAAGAAPLFAYLKRVTDEEFAEKFSRKYGSGGPTEFFFELAHIVSENDSSFNPDGLLEYIASRDEGRVKEAEDTIKYIESKVTDLIVDHFKALHGEKYWQYLGTADMRVKSYQRQQEYPPEKQLDLEAYLDFIDKKKIVEKSENWPHFKDMLDIPLQGEKPSSKNIKWLERLNELRRVVAHSHKRSFRPEDLEFLEWIRREFDRRLLVIKVDTVAAEV